MKTKEYSIFRTVGFTNSTYMDGDLEIGWKGDFFPTRDEAESAGCGVDENWHNGTEVREYKIKKSDIACLVFVDGILGTRELHDEVVAAAIDLGLTHADPLEALE